MIGFRESHAVVIGIDDYGPGIPALRTAVNDARRVAEVLETNFGYTVHLLTESVTLEQLRAVFVETLPREVEAEDRLLVYFAGHGIALDGDDGPAGYLVPQDARREDRGTFLPMTALSSYLDRLPCRHLLLVLDCCFAGAFRWSSTRDLGALPEIIHRERFDRYVRDPAWQVLTSASHDQKALDVLSGETIGLRDVDGHCRNHSPFAAAFLRALQGEADLIPRSTDGRAGGDGVITATELYLYLRECVETGSEGVGHRQTPGFWPLKRHDKGEFIHLVPGHELNLPPAPPLSEANNPWRGLQSYDEQHAPLFFGRSKFVATLADRVRAQPLTVVLGASGTGKSSLVKAGLIAHLRSREADAWRMVPAMRPGKAPLAALASLALPGESTAQEAIAVRLDAARLDPEALAIRVADWETSNASAASPSPRLLIVVDQFEELLTHCRDAAEFEQFLSLLDRALELHPDCLRLILTLRSDFEPQFAHTPLSRHWLASRVVVPVLTLDEYREVIEGPASVRVLYFQGKQNSQGFVSRLIGDVASTPGALPLLAFTLSELYRRYLARVCDDRSLSEDDYDALGGVGGSLRNRADEVYDGLLDEAHRATLRRVMLRMVSVEGGEPARRRVPEGELVYEQPGEGERVAEVLLRMTDARMVVRGTDEDELTYIEPAHDALIRGWGRLLGWVREGLEGLQLRRRLTPAAAAWSGGRGGLWVMEPRLGLLKHEERRMESWLNADEARFVRRSVAGRRNAVLAACGAAAALMLLLAAAGLLTARIVRNLPNERVDAARVTLVRLGFGVSDKSRDQFVVTWDDGIQGTLPPDAWRDAAAPLRLIDSYRTIDRLELIYCNVPDLRPLDGLKSIRCLKVLGSQADDLSPIRGMSSVETLVLNDIKAIDDDDLQVLQDFRRLTSLDLTGCTRLTDRCLNSIAGLPIEELILSKCKNIGRRDIGPLLGSPVRQLVLDHTGARIEQALVERLLSLQKLATVDLEGLPADDSELSRLREAGRARGFQVRVGQPAKSKNPYHYGASPALAVPTGDAPPSRGL